MRASTGERFALPFYAGFVVPCSHHQALLLFHSQLACSASAVYVQRTHIATLHPRYSRAGFTMQALCAPAPLGWRWARSWPCP